MQLLPAMDSGGVERGTLDVARALRASGIRATVISDGGALVAPLTETGATHLRWPIGRKRPDTLRFVKPLRRWLAEHHVDIVHARSRLPGWIGYLAWRGMQEPRPRFVTTVHGLYSVGRYSSVMVRGERIIAVSEAVREYIVTNYRNVDPDRIVIIPRGVADDEFPRDFTPSPEWQTEFFQAYPQLSDRWLIALPGRLTRLKGHHEFLDIVAALARDGIPVHGMVIGAERKPGDRYVAQLMAQVKARGLPITFLGRRSDMRELYATAHVVLSLSSHPESFGRTVLEALAMGTPVVGYAHGGVKEILSRVFPSGGVAPGDVQAAVERLAAVYQTPPEIPATHPFTLDAMLSKTIALYHEMVAR
ncbi:MAG: glycosyltransferase family 4 protein [Pseudomonadota bacterium]